ncbi:DUF742 domain-containing protein [Actinoplanes sp. NPDC026619]|uniref:DUF742 domain-containing protein n=1 Tax=Actinoplanes sp. NPDC026619 TaxID=3155798 RepID=UPI00340A52D3
MSSGSRRRPGAGSHHADEDPVVRPFMLTGGRTQPMRDGLRIETQLHAAPAALSAPLRFEARRIVELCQAPMSIADLSATMGAPLGVVRVIVADLITEGHVLVEDRPGDLPTTMIERIRDLVRAL